MTAMYHPRTLKPAIGGVTCLLVMCLALAACSTPPYRSNSTGSNAPVTTETNSAAQLQAATPQAEVEPAETLPVAPTRSYTLNAASTALVNQAHAQLASKNSMMAAATIERALRIEPGNPLLWLEYAQVRMSEANYTQAESMARKALASATGDAHTQASAWRLIADSLRAQNKTSEAQQADVRADGLGGR